MPVQKQHEGHRPPAALKAGISYLILYVAYYDRWISVPHITNTEHVAKMSRRRRG